MSKVVGSPQQEAFWRELVEGSTHVLLEARAGTGKSFSAREGMRRVRGTRTYCAFNKHIAEEFNRDLPNGCRAATMHGLGFAACKSAWKDVLVDGNKTMSLLKGLGETKSITYESRGGLVKLVSLCKGEMSDGTSPDEMARLVARHDIEFGRDKEDAIAAVPAVLAACRADTARVDFDDMLWMPLVHDLSPRTSDFLFVDEAQDLNPAQQRFALRLCPDGRIVVIGDRYQSIYGFRGADVESIPNMERTLAATPRGLKRLPLTVTRRCPAAHVEMAKFLVHDLEAMPGAPEGVIDVQSEDRAESNMQPGDMVVCRVNAPLVGTAFRLIRSGVRAYVKGRDFGKSLAKFVRDFGARDIPHLCEEVEAYRFRETMRLKAVNARDAVVTLNDKCDCVNAIASASKTVDDVVDKIEALFAEDGEDCVTLSSVHRAKGLEAERVYVLAPEKMPHPLAEQAWEVAQERNIAYVAATRSKRELIFVGPIPSILGGW